MAELTRAYSNFRIPPLDVIVNSAMSVHATLVQQSEGLSPLVPAIDAEPVQSNWRSTRPYQAEVVRLYKKGRSLTSISREVGISWDSVARLLDIAGVRARNRGRPLA